MVIVETPVFTRLIKQLMSDDEYKDLQEALVNRPDMGGGLIKGSGDPFIDSKNSGQFGLIWY
jgi:hypothetical protein